MEPFLGSEEKEKNAVVYRKQKERETILVMDGNALYELDERCMKRKKQRKPLRRGNVRE